MSRPTKRTKLDTAEVPTGTPVVVWVIYALGFLAGTIVVFALLFVAGAYLASDDVPVTVGVSTLAIALWGGLIALALGTWFVRRRGKGR